MHTMKKVRGPVERIAMDREQLDTMETDIFLRRHVERYAMIRQHLYGTVLDCACGVGYGSYLVSKNPDVQQVIGVDCSPEAISHAQHEFGSDKTTFLCDDIAMFEPPMPIDILVSLETIEHLMDRQALPSLARRLDVPHLILSFPSKKTTHYNAFHHHDFRRQDLIDLFDEYILYQNVDLHGEVEMLFFALHPRWISRPRPGSSLPRPDVEDLDGIERNFRPPRKPPASC